MSFDLVALSRSRTPQSWSRLNLKPQTPVGASFGGNH